LQSKCGQSPTGADAAAIVCAANDESRSPAWFRHDNHRHWLYHRHDNHRHWLYRGMSRIRFDHGLRQSVLGRVIMPMRRLCKQSRVFFGKENQVLRLWARVMRGLSSDGSSVPLFSRLV